ncbi:Endocytosis protein end4 [Smittium culicis]|uniref:Endocytosis protein end4 n=1 Tax=Smittium culicis TaxID=133412 RepID=A0A1R1YQ99_9FUNG|nr:Endocytosis protein end4 [Smittium culicis]
MIRNSYSLRAGDRIKAETDLFQAIKKATTSDENAPKQKHVRKIIVFTWDFKTSIPVWNGLQSFPLVSEEVSCFKALIVIHKFIRNGAHMCIVEALQKTVYLESLGRSGSQGSWKGYGILIHAYTNYILAKLEYHRLHPEFNGCFDYEEYISLRGTYDPNEGYETIADLMSLQDRLDELQKLIFRNFTPGSNNECKIAALVPLVEESYGIYNFATRMLIAMHGRVDGADEALEPLRNRFNTQHHRLRKFYSDCSKLRYLTSLITVPKLTQTPPSVLNDGEFVPPENLDLQNPSTSQMSEDNSEADRLERERKERENARIEQEKLQIEQQTKELQRIENERLQMEQNAREAQRLQMEEQQKEQMRIAHEQQMMEQRAREQQLQFDELQRQRLMQEQIQLNQQQNIAGRLQEHENQIALLNSQHERDLLTISQYNQRVSALEQQLNQQKILMQQSDASKDELIKALQAQIDQWKQKYDALAKLYAQLRQEHFDLLGKYKSIYSKANEADEANRKILQMQEFISSKNLELAELMGERDKARDEVTKAQNASKSELSRLESELSNLRDHISEKTRAHSKELEELKANFTRENSDFLSQLNHYKSNYEDSHSKLLELQDKFENAIQEKDEEIAVYQAGMDQSIIALANAQQQSQGSRSDLQQKLKELAREHAAKLLRILDSIFQSCAESIDDSLFNFTNHEFPGSSYATPSFVLAQIEQINGSSNTFTSSFSGYLVNPEGEQTQLIRSATDLSSLISTYLPNVKGLIRFSMNFEESQELNNLVIRTAELGKAFYTKGQSSAMQDIPVTRRPEIVFEANRGFQSSLSLLSAFIEKFVSREDKGVRSITENEDLSDVVDREMMNAASAIQAAADKIQQIMTTKVNTNLTDAQVNINDAILDNVLNMTNAIARLIQASKESQQEIVAEGRGTSTKTAFYKQHNRWTEGLISAAKAVAMATNFLVEIADAVIRGDKSLEDLIIAAREVSASTAQLVAASRVKSKLHSKTLNELELAAKSVTHVVRDLVNTVTVLSERSDALRDLNNGGGEQKQREVYQNWSSYEFKSNEMEQQVAILKIEKDLITARRKLAEMRKYGYHADESDTEQ